MVQLNGGAVVRLALCGVVNVLVLGVLLVLRWCRWLSRLAPVCGCQVVGSLPVQGAKHLRLYIPLSAIVKVLVKPSKQAADWQLAGPVPYWDDWSVER